MNLNKLSCCLITYTDDLHTKVNFELHESEYYRKVTITNLESDKAFNVMANMIGVSMLTRIDNICIYLIDPDYAYEIASQLSKQMDNIRNESSTYLEECKTSKSYI